MHTIFKYPIPAVGKFSIDLPHDAKVLSVQAQHNEPFLWALVSADKLVFKTSKTFRSFGTGHQINENPETLHYIGTFQLDEGNFVGHLFEIVQQQISHKD
jgi:hypothetical protein